MNVDFVRELELRDEDRDDDRRVVRIDTSLDVGTMTFRQRMTRHFFNRQSEITCHILIRKFRKSENASQFLLLLRSEVSLYPLCLDLRTMPNSEYWGIAGYNLVPDR